MKSYLTLSLLFFCVSLSAATDQLTVIERSAVGAADNVLVYCDKGFDSYGSFSVKIVGVNTLGRTTLLTLTYPTDFTQVSSLMYAASYDLTSTVNTGSYTGFRFKVNSGTIECRGGVSANATGTARQDVFDLEATLSGTDSYEVFVFDHYTGENVGDNIRLVQEGHGSNSSFGKTTQSASSSVEFTSSDNFRNQYFDVKLKEIGSSSLHTPDHDLSALVDPCTPTSADDAICDCTRPTVRYSSFDDTTNNNFVITSACVADGAYGVDVHSLSVGVNTIGLSDVAREAMKEVDASYANAPDFVFDGMEEDVLYLGNVGGNNSLDAVLTATDQARQPFAVYDGTTAPSTSGTGMSVITATKGGVTGKRSVGVDTAPVLAITPPSIGKRFSKGYSRYCVGAECAKGTDVIDWVAVHGGSLQLTSTWTCGPRVYNEDYDKWAGCELEWDAIAHEKVTNARSIAGVNPEVQFSGQGYSVGQRTEPGSFTVVSFDIDTRLANSVTAKAMGSGVEPETVPELTIYDVERENYSISVHQYGDSWISITDAIALPNSKFSKGYLDFEIEYYGDIISCNVMSHLIGSMATHVHFDVQSSGVATYSVQDLNMLNVEMLPKTYYSC